MKKSTNYCLTAVMLLVSLLSILHIVLFLKSGLNVYDEGVSVFAAARVAEGDVPYRDFWTMYAPAQFYALAGVFKLFGFSILAERIFSAVLLLCIAVLTSYLVGRIYGRSHAFLTLMLCLVWCSSFEGRGTAVVAAVMLIMFSCLPILKFLETYRKRYAFCAGIIAGCAVLFRHDLGVLTVAAQAGVLLLAGCACGAKGRVGRGEESVSADYADGDDGRRGYGSRALFGAGLYLVGAGVVVLPVLILLLMAVPLSVLVDCLFVFPGKVYPLVRSLPYPMPGIQTLVFYFVPGIYILSAVRLGFDLCRRRCMLTDGSSLRTILFLALGVLFMGGVFVRPDVTHLFPVIFPAIVLLQGFLIAAGRESSEVRSHKALVLYAVVVGVVALTFLRPFIFQVTNLVSLRNGYGGVVMKTERASGVRIEKSRGSYDNLIKYIQDHVPQDSSVFFGNLRHDRISINDVMLYFLCDRKSVTRYHELHPGLATTLECQKEIVGEIKNDGTALVVLAGFYDEDPDEDIADNGSTLLDEFLKDNFVYVTNFGNYAVLRGRGTIPVAGF